MNNNYYNRKREGEGVEMRKLIIAILIIFVLFAGNAEATSNQGFFSIFEDYFSNYFVNIFSSDDSHGVPIPPPFHPIPPTIILDPTFGHVGDSIQINGEMFPSQFTTYQILFDGETIGPLFPYQGWGSFTLDFVIPDAEKGTHIISIAHIGGTEVARANFEVLDWPRPTPSITLNPENGNVGDSVLVNGINFPTHSLSLYSMSILFDNEVVYSFWYNLTLGSFSESFEVPDTYAGYHKVSIEGHPTANEDFFVAPPPSANISVTPNEGYVGDNIIINGSYFGENETFEVYLNKINVATITTNNEGYFEDNFEVPELDEGIYKITVDNYNTTIDFEVLEEPSQPDPELNVEPNEGYVGDLIGISGLNFSTNETLEIYLGDVNILNIFTETGSFDTTFIVPELSIGHYNITVVGYNVSVSFEVLEEPSQPEPTMEIDPTSGFADDEIEISGSYFTENISLWIMLDSSLVANVTTDDNGSFDTVFIVPSVEAGNYTIATIPDHGVSLIFEVLEEEEEPESEEEEEEEEEIEPTPRHNFFTDHVSLSSNYVKDGETTNIILNLMNTGLTDEEDMIIEVYSPILGIHEVIENVLLERLEPSNIEIPITIPLGISDGTYSLNVNVYSPYYTYEDSYMIEDTISVVVSSGDDVDVVYTSTEASEEEVKTTSVFSNPMNMLLFGIVLFSLLILIGMSIFKAIKDDKEEF